MKNISVVMIAKNEEDIIGKALVAVSWISDKVVIIDDASTDKTEEISKAEGAVVFRRKWAGAANQKNFGISKAKNKWILSIDADEIVTPALSKEIKELPQDQFDGYTIPFRNYLGKTWLRHGGLHPDYHLRLFKKELGQFRGIGGGQTHESVNLERFGYLKNPIDHPTYDNVSDLWFRVLNYSKSEGRALRDSKSRIGLKEVVKIPGRFFKVYFFQLGLLDGWYGFLNAVFMSCYQVNKLVFWLGVRK